MLWNSSHLLYTLTVLEGLLEIFLFFGYIGEWAEWDLFLSSAPVTGGLSFLSKYFLLRNMYYFCLSFELQRAILNPFLPPPWHQYICIFLYFWLSFLSLHFWLFRPVGNSFYKVQVFYQKYFFLNKISFELSKISQLCWSSKRGVFFFKSYWRL